MRRIASPFLPVQPGHSYPVTDLFTPITGAHYHGSHVEETGGLCWVRLSGYPRWSIRSFWWCVVWVSVSNAYPTTMFTDVFRYDTGTIGGILGMNYWRKTFSTGFINKTDNMLDVSAEQTSLIVSILSAGTFFGALTAAPTADVLGRRLGLVASNVVFCVGVILQTIATNIPLFVAGRFFAGFGVGMISATIPLYQSETAPKWIRGVIVGAYQLAITIGILLANIVNNATKDRDDTGSYRIPIAVQFAWAIILFVGCIFLPETPRWYIKKGRPEHAAKSLSKLRRLDIEHPAVVEELAEITANHEYELSLGKATYLDCFKGSLGKRLATGCLLQALQQLTGVNFICKYKSNVLKWMVLTVNSLLWYFFLQELGHQQPLCGFHDNFMRQRRLYLPWSLPCREVGPPQSVALRCHRDGCLPVHRRNHWNGCWYRKSVCSKGPHCIRLHLHLLLRLLLGSSSLGCDWRNFPTQGPREVSFHDDCIQLAPQLCHWLCYTLHG